VAGALLVAIVVGSGCRDATRALEGPDCRQHGVCAERGGAAASGVPTGGGDPGVSVGGGPSGAGGERSRGGDASSGARGEAGASGDDPAPSGFTEVVCRDLGDETTCEVDGSGAELVVRGDVLTAARSFRGGEVRVRRDGTIACAGCDCAAATGARRITCPGAVVAPAFVNPHDHIAYAHEPPRPAREERYDHRHDWRLGLRGHGAIEYDGGASPAARAAHELRMLMDGVTAIAGGAGHRGLVRNLDVPGLDEGVFVALAGSDTFPLDDADGLLVRSGCAYGAGRTRADEAERFGAYLPHLGEGVDAEAENEVRCALAASLVAETTAVVHAVAVDAALARSLAARRALVVWSPRSNLALYGNTAPVSLLRHSGVELALGTDWLLSGSMTMRRELACARSFSERYLDDELDDRALARMATESAARAVGASIALGRIRPGFFADLQIVRRRGLEPHAAVVRAAPDDMRLVLRAGAPLYGDRDTVEALAGGGCETLDVCGVAKAVCLSETGRTLAELAQASPYPLFACDTPPNEPSCTPVRPGEYDGVPSDFDEDGDGVENERDACPRVFDPPRPLDAGRQADADGDGFGDACDPCPLDDDELCPRRSPDDLDGDRIDDAVDNCPREPNASQTDRDADDIGDACDTCTSENPGVVPCPLTVAALRNPLDLEHPPRHGLVRVEGVDITALRPDTGAQRGYYVTQGNAPFSGIFVFTAGASPGVSFEERVTLRGRLDVYQGTHEVVASTLLERTSSDGAFVPLLVEARDIGDESALFERYESMLVTVENVTVVDENPDAPSDYDETLLDGALRLDDLLDPALDNTFAQGTRFRSVTGVLGFSFGHNKLWPRGPDDIVLE
jgi:imidazolonepropionase-like amidohydrolase